MLKFPSLQHFFERFYFGASKLMHTPNPRHDSSIFSFRNKNIWQHIYFELTVNVLC